MKEKIYIIYASNTGNTETLAQMIKEHLSVPATVVSVTDVNLDDMSNSDLVLFGSSTWGYGNLQDDFEEFIEQMTPGRLAGKNVAVFGCGDQDNFEDMFCHATDIIREKALECGANIVAENLRINGQPEDYEDLVIDFVSSLPLS